MIRARIGLLDQEAVMNQSTHAGRPLRALAAAALVGAALLPTSAVAGKPSAVPLNPVPPDYYTCTPNGAGTYCSGRTVTPYGPDPSGIWCASAGFEILDQAVRVDDNQRWYDRDGNIVKRVRVHTFQDAAFSSSSGARVPYSQRDQDIDTYPIPGDMTYGTTKLLGSLRATVPGYGTVLLEKGQTVYGVEGTLDKDAGVHELTPPSPPCARPWVADTWLAPAGPAGAPVSASSSRRPRRGRSG
jgi:hypothetical protein